MSANEAQIVEFILKGIAIVLGYCGVVGIMLTLFFGILDES